MVPARFTLLFQYIHVIAGWLRAEVPAADSSYRLLNRLHMNRLLVE